MDIDDLTCANWRSIGELGEVVGLRQPPFSVSFLCLVNR